jgi:hypothetical protein
MGSEISLCIKPHKIFLSVKPSIKIGALRTLIAQNVDVILDELIIEIAG